jgi:hypothetical protein
VLLLSALHAYAVVQYPQVSRIFMSLDLFSQLGSDCALLLRWGASVDARCLWGTEREPAGWWTPATYSSTHPHRASGKLAKAQVRPLTISLLGQSFSSANVFILQ